MAIYLSIAEPGITSKALAPNRVATPDGLEKAEFKILETPPFKMEAATDEQNARLRANRVANERAIEQAHKWGFTGSSRDSGGQQAIDAFSAGLAQYIAQNRPLPEHLDKKV